MKLAPTRTSTVEILEARIAPAFASVIQLSALNGSDGFKINGEAANNSLGTSVSDAGDVNGDGFGDLIIGAHGVSPAGASYVVFGKASGFTANLDLSTLDGTDGFQINGVDPGDGAGGAVSGAGDVNNDGFDDLIIGAGGANSARGASFVVFGKADFSATAGNLNLSTLNGTDGFRLSGVADYDNSGVTLSGAGDVNGDGFGDLLIGASGVSSGRGAAYVVFGKASGFAANVNLSSLNGTTGFKISGSAAYDGALIGTSVSSAGDVNGDGFDDVIVGAPTAAANGSDPGASFLIFGKSSGFSSSFLLSSLNGFNGFKISGVAGGDQAGISVSGAGDVNGDGFDDVLIGAQGAAPNGSYSGSSYLVFGKAAGFASNLNLSTLNGTTGFKISGVAAYDRSGRSVSSAGDVNGDGFDDLIVSSYGADPNGSYSGSSYVVFGKASGFTANLNLSTLNGTTGFRLDGVAVNEFSGRSVSGAGDLNGDGFDDLIIGAEGAAPNGSFSGASYVVFGQPTLGTLSADGKTATFTDVDGDLVTVKTTAGTLDGTNFSLSKVPGGVAGGAQLSRLDLSDAEFAGASITITAKRGALGGDGLVNLGFLDATGVDLGVVSLKGDLGRFAIGDGTGPSATSLTVSSLGVYGASTQVGITPSLASTAAGELPLLTISGDVGGITFTAPSLGTAKIAGTVEGATFTISGGIAALTVGGDFLDSALTATGTAASLKFSGSLENALLTLATTTKLLIGDSVLGSTISGGSFGSITPGLNPGTYMVLGGISVLGEVEGSTIYSTANIANLTIAGDVSDTSALTAAGGFGSIEPGATPGSVKLNGGLFLNGAVSSTDILSGGDTATLSVARRVTSTTITIDGDVGSAKFGRSVRDLGFLAGGDVTNAAFSGSIVDSTFGVVGDLGTLTAGTTPGTVKITGGISVKGSVIDSTIETDGDLAKLTVGRRLDGSTVSARGAYLPADEIAAQTIGAIAIAGRVKNSSILAGYDRDGEALNDDVQIGKVTVGTHWIASNLIAGTTSGVDEIFGTTDDALIGGGNSTVSKIAAVVIAGHVRGTAGGVDAFGFVAQEVKAFTASATALPLTLGAGNDLTGFALGSTFDVRVREVV